MYKYFICAWVEDEDNIPRNDICEFDFDILENEAALREAERILLQLWFCDSRYIVITSVTKLS